MRASGVTLVDRALGGLEPGLPLVVCGGSGTGRTVLALELIGAALGRGEPAILLTSVPAALLLRHACSLGLDLAPAVAAGQLALLELDAAAPAQLRGVGVDAFVAALRAELPDAALIVIDPITTLTAELLDEAPLRALVRGVFAGAGPGEARVVVTVEEDALRASAVLDRALGDLCGARVRLSREPDGRRWLRVEKSRAGAPGAERLEFVIGENGTTVLGEGGGAEREGASRAAPASAGPGAARADTRRRVLVVEDDVTLRRQLTDWLGDLYQVSEAEDGFTALSEVLAEPPDLLILDLMLPRVGGAELIAALAKAGTLTPTLVVSGRMARTADRVRVLALGASDTLEKPVHRIELLRKVETLVALPRVAGPSPHLADAASLLADTSTTRLLDARSFAERLRRASRFGELADMPSALVAVEAKTPEALDALLHVADTTLRTEDGILGLSDRRALLLLVASTVEACESVVRRLTASLQQNGVRTSSLSWRSVRAETIALPQQGAASDEVWKPCFEALARWPGETRAA